MDTNTPQAVCIPRDIQLRAAVDRLQSMNQEILNGYKILGKYKKTVTVFGSTRTNAGDFYYQKAKEFGDRISREGYAVVTGGGHGIMAAANQGAFEAGGASIGFNIKLPQEQNLNPYVTESYSFSHFAPRKVMMTLFAHAYIYFPGGFGTLDELSEIMTLTQTKKTNLAPIILFDSGYWSDLDLFIKDHMLKRGLISDEDLSLYTITDSVDEIIQAVDSNHVYCESND